MTNTSSRVLSDADQAVVTPMTWRAATFTLPPKARTSPSQVARAPMDQPASDQDRIGRQELDLAEQEAYQKGFSEGKNAGREQAVAELQPVLVKLGRSLATLSSLRSQYLSVCRVIWQLFASMSSKKHQPKWLIWAKKMWHGCACVPLDIQWIIWKSKRIFAHSCGVLSGIVIHTK